ncbi:MAG: response regulator, partial [Nitrososphaeraceae archaeon]
DDTDSQFPYKSVLGRQSYQVILTNAAEDCLKIYQHELQNLYLKTDAVEHEQPFDAVILDFKKPHIHGIEVASEIFAVNSRQRIIFVAKYDKDLRIDSIAHLKEPVEVLQKPFSDKTLIDVIEQNEMYRELERMNINTKYVKFANFRHEQIRKMLELLKKSRSDQNGQQAFLGIIHL